MEGTTSLEREIARLRDEIALSPRNLELKLKYGHACLVRDRRLEALRVYQEVLNEEENAEARLALAKIFALQEYYAEAYDELRKLFSLDPMNLQGHVLLHLLKEKEPVPAELAQHLEFVPNRQFLTEQCGALLADRDLLDSQISEYTAMVFGVTEPEPMAQYCVLEARKCKERLVKYLDQCKEWGRNAMDGLPFELEDRKSAETEVTRPSADAGAADQVFVAAVASGEPESVGMVLGNAESSIEQPAGEGEVPVAEDGRPAPETATASEAEQPATEAETVTEDGQPATEAETATEGVQPATEAETATEDGQSATEAETATEVGQPATEAETATEGVQPATEAESATEDVQPATEVETVAEDGQSATEAESASEAEQPATEAEIATEDGQPATEAETASEEGAPVAEVATVAEDTGSAEVLSTELLAEGEAAQADDSAARPESPDAALEQNANAGVAGAESEEPKFDNSKFVELLEVLRNNRSIRSVVLFQEDRGVVAQTGESTWVGTTLLTVSECVKAWHELHDTMNCWILESSKGMVYIHRLNGRHILIIDSASTNLGALRLGIGKVVPSLNELI